MEAARKSAARKPDPESSFRRVQVARAFQSVHTASSQIGATEASLDASPLEVPGPPSEPVGVVGTAATYYALAQYFDASGSTHNVLYNSTWGLWTALVGYLLAGVGAAIGPRGKSAT